MSKNKLFQVGIYLNNPNTVSGVMLRDNMVLVVDGETKENILKQFEGKNSVMEVALREMDNLLVTRFINVDKIMYIEVREMEDIKSESENV